MDTILFETSAYCVTLTDVERAAEREFMHEQIRRFNTEHSPHHAAARQAGAVAPLDILVRRVRAGNGEILRPGELDGGESLGIRPQNDRGKANGGVEGEMLRSDELDGGVGLGARPQNGRGEVGGGAEGEMLRPDELDGGVALITQPQNDRGGEIIGGLVADTYWDWLEINYLWLDERLRGHRLGARLLQAAEAEARRRGCRHAQLTTFSFQARGFYEKMGYRVVGQLDDYPPGGAYYWLRKDFADGAGI